MDSKYYAIQIAERALTCTMRWTLKIHKFSFPHLFYVVFGVSVTYEIEMKRQRDGQHKLEEAMERQETEQQREEQIKNQQQWLIKQLK